MHNHTQELSEWACIYIKYLQIFRKLETAYDQMLQPQKRQDMKKALEACMGRMLEIRHWMVGGPGASHRRSILLQAQCPACCAGAVLWGCPGGSRQGTCSCSVFHFDPCNHDLSSVCLHLPRVLACQSWAGLMC